MPEVFEGNTIETILLLIHSEYLDGAGYEEVANLFVYYQLRMVLERAGWMDKDEKLLKTFSINSGTSDKGVLFTMELVDEKEITKSPQNSVRL